MGYKLASLEQQFNEIFAPIERHAKESHNVIVKTSQLLRAYFLSDAAGRNNIPLFKIELLKKAYKIINEAIVNIEVKLAGMKVNFSYTTLELNREKITPFFSYQLKAPARLPKVKKSDDGTYIGYF